MSNQNWIKCEWSFDDLNGKIVEFSLFEDGKHILGKGTFLVYLHPNDFIEVEILSENQTGIGANQLLIKLTPNKVRLIQRHPNSKAADFRLMEQF